MNSVDVVEAIASVCRDGHLGDAAASGIKAYITLPFTQSSTGHNTAAAANPSSAATSATLTAPHLFKVEGVDGGFRGFSGSSTQQQGPSASMTPAGDTQSVPVAAVSDVDEHLTKAKCLLSLLLLCGDAERSPAVVTMMSPLAPTVASNLADFIKTEVSPSALSLRDFSRNAHMPTAKSRTNSVLIAAQCLFLLTRHFQMQTPSVHALLSVLEVLLQEISYRTDGSTATAKSFRQHPSTRELCALTWLLVMSLANTLTVWRNLRDIAGNLQENALLRTNVIADIEKWMTEFHGKLARARDTGFLCSSSLIRRENSHSKHQQQLRHGDTAWCGGDGKCPLRLAVVEGYMSIVLLSVGIFLCGKGDERGLDKAVEAFVGYRAQSSGVVRRGKVMKYIVDLAPTQATLTIPLEYIYIVPYEMVAHIFDEMLIVAKHVADIDISSCVRYSEALQSRSDIQLAVKYGVSRGTSAARVKDGMRQNMQNKFFSSETAHILRALTICLENLPSTVLNPDMDADCAVTFFIFKNCVTHMRAVFQTQQSSEIWEPHTLKVVTRFIDVLSMIGRNSQYTERVLALFTEMQVDCTELQWSSLIAQAQACAGANSETGLFVPVDESAGMRALRKPSTGSGAVSGLHRQFTLEYQVEKQQEFASSVFVLLRQMAIHPLLHEQVRQHTTLNVVLGFFYATKLSQEVLGKVLSLIGSFITTHEEASCVWTFLEENHLICNPDEPPAVKDGERPYKARGNREERGRNVAATVAARSLLGHCQYECHHAKYSITIGFLDLMLAMFKYHRPDAAVLPSYTVIIRFISEEIFRGVHKRSFSEESERYIVTALAAAVLNRALSMYSLLHESNDVPSFQLVMACSKAPADVLGEVLQFVSEAAAAPHEMFNYQRAAVRQCLALLRTAITMKKEQGLNSIFTFDARTLSSKEFASQLLPLCVSFDNLLANKALQVMLLLPHSTLSQAVRQWSSKVDALETVIAPYVSALQEGAVSNPIVHAPPALAILDNDEVQLLIPHADKETKSLMLDLLIKHAGAPQPSITSWLCGYQMSGPVEELLPGHCLEPVVEGARSRVLEETCPHIAVKYVRLLYELRANPSLGASTLERFMKERGSDEMFYVLKTLQPNRCSPLVLSKYSFVMKLLALELFTISTTFPDELNDLSPLTPHASVVELLFQLLQASSPRELYDRPSDSSTHALLDGYDAGVSLDFAQWPSACLKSLPSFPSNCVAPGGAESYVFRASDDVPQYSIPRLYEALKRSNVANKRESLSVEELRDQLSVFTRANECLLAYSSAVQFLDGWCTLTNTTLFATDFVSDARIVHLSRSVLETMQLVSNLTVAAQEQIVQHISRTTATLAAQLKRRFLQKYGTKGPGGERDQNQENGVEASVTGDNYMEAGAAPLHLTQHGENSSRLQLSAVGRSAGSATESHLCGGRKRDVRGTVVNRNNTTGALSTFVDTPGRTAAHSENLQLLRALLAVTVQWGSRVPAARHHLYDAISVFVGISSACADDVMLQQYHNALFDVVVQDTAVTATNCNRFSALPLLGQLMHASPQLCELFCVSVTNDGVSTRLVSCVTRCFQAIDESVSTFFSHGGGHISSILWFIRVVFDLLMVISQRHTLQLTHANALLHCTSMKLWEAGGRIVLGHVKYATDPSLSAVENMEPFKEVIRIVLLYTVRWFNAVLSALDNSQAALAPIADFVFAHQLLFQSMLVSPTTSAQRRYIDTPALELYNEISGVLLRLASSPLVNKCQPLVHLFSLTELLDILTRSEFINMPIFLEDSVPTPAASSTFVANQRASLPSAYQQQQIAAATQHVVIFIFLTENLAPFLHGHGEENIAVGRHQSSAPHKQSHLRYDAGSRLLITRIMENVLVIIERLCNSNIVSAATAVPYFISVHCLVLLLHAFLIVDRMLPVTKVTDGSHWSHIVHALEEARRVMNGWKVLHSDYRKGVQVRRTGDHWSVAAPSVSNQSMHAAPATITAAADEERPPLLHSSTAAGSGAAGRAPLIPVEVASGLLPSSPATGNLTTIGALVGFVGSGAAVSEKEPAALRGAVDQVLVLESLLRRVKVAVSNALREASRP